MFDRRALIDAIILVGVIIVVSPAYTQERSAQSHCRKSGQRGEIMPTPSR